MFSDKFYCTNIDRFCLDISLSSLLYFSLYSYPFYSSSERSYYFRCSLFAYMLACDILTFPSRNVSLLYATSDLTFCFLYLFIFVNLSLFILCLAFCIYIPFFNITVISALSSSVILLTSLVFYVILNFP